MTVQYCNNPISVRGIKVAVFLHYLYGCVDCGVYTCSTKKEGSSTIIKIEVKQLGEDILLLTKSRGK